MPYLRLYARDLQIEQKRVIAQNLIQITLRTFQLRAKERYRTTIQFVTPPAAYTVCTPWRSMPRNADITLEVIAHGLTEEKKRAFAAEASEMLNSLEPVKPWRRIASFLGISTYPPQHISFEFNELNPGISDPFVAESERLVA